MTPTPQAALLISDLELRAIYEKHQLATADIVISDLRRILIDAQAAILAKLQATQEPVQAGELPDEREAFEATVLKGNPSAVLTKSRNGCYQDDELQVMWWAWQARSALSARKPLTPLTPAQMEKGRDQIFSINNPFCPCDSKTFSKVAEWVERHHGIGLEVKP